MTLQHTWRVSGSKQRAKPPHSLASNQTEDTPRSISIMNGTCTHKACTALSAMVCAQKNKTTTIPHYASTITSTKIALKFTNSTTKITPQESAKPCSTYQWIRYPKYIPKKAKFYVILRLFQESWSVPYRYSSKRKADGDLHMQIRTPEWFTKGHQVTSSLECSSECKTSALLLMWVSICLFLWIFNKRIWRLGFWALVRCDVVSLLGWGMGFYYVGRSACGRVII